MISRVIFALKNGIKCKEKIKHILNKKNSIFDNVTHITIEDLKQNNTRVLVLDFDGVLASHGKNEVNKDVYNWLKIICDSFEGYIAILSNKPNLKRSIYFNQNFPDIKFISNVAKKPYPDGLLKVCSIFNVAPKYITLVDDRILTGMLAAILANTQIIYISKPYIDINYSPIAERYFAMLRYIEKILYRR